MTSTAHSSQRPRASAKHAAARWSEQPRWFTQLLVPVTTILGTSRMVPKDAVLRWPRLYGGAAAAKTGTHADTQKHAQPYIQLPTKTKEACRCSGLGSDGAPWTGVEHMQSLRCARARGSMHTTVTPGAAPSDDDNNNKKAIPGSQGSVFQTLQAVSYC